MFHLQSNPGDGMEIPPRLVCRDGINYQWHRMPPNEWVLDSGYDVFKHISSASKVVQTTGK